MARTSGMQMKSEHYGNNKWHAVQLESELRPEQRVCTWSLNIMTRKNGMQLKSGYYDKIKRYAVRV
jgi:hypothetical protein